MNPDEITTQEAAELLGVTRTAVLLAIARRTLPVKRRWGMGAYILSRRDVLAYRAARRVGRPPKMKKMK